MDTGVWFLSRQDWLLPNMLALPGRTMSWRAARNTPRVIDTLPANKTRVVFKTATTPGGGSFNEIYFEDRKGAEEMFINASRDMKIRTHNV